MKGHWNAGFLAVLLTASAFMACGRGERPERDAVSDALASAKLTARESRGQRLFAKRCATCHGLLGRGDGQNASRMTPTPPDMSSSLGKVSSADRRRIIVLGSAAVGRSALCPPRGESLRPEEVDALLAWLDVAARPAAPEEAPPAGERRRWRSGAR